MFKGHFITIEGGDGAGKSTLLNQLAIHLRKQNYDVVITREPGGSLLGDTIRNWVLTRDAVLKIGGQAELLLFLAARSQHIQELIFPALEEGKIVICDRFNDSTIAYQGAGRGLEIKYVKKLCDLVCGWVKPQLTLLLDIPPEVGLLRVSSTEKEQAKGGQLDRIESEDLEFHRRIRQAFLSLAKREPFRIYTIRADRPFPDVLKEALLAIDELVLLPEQKRKPVLR